MSVFFFSSLSSRLFALPPLSVLGLAAVVLAAVLGGAVVYIRFWYVDYPRIQGLPEIPGGSALAGHLYQLGDDHATTAERWAAQYGWPVFQMRMGYRRAVVLNSFASARAWIVQHQSATLDRPWFYTFHGVVSATSAATIGTSPWNERTKKQRRIVGSLTTGPAIQRLAPMLDLETAAMVSAMLYDARAADDGELVPHVYQKRVSLNIMTMFCYGTRFASVADPLLQQILADATTIASFRSTSANPQDYVPHLRGGPAVKKWLGLASDSRTATAVAVRARRDTWLAAMLDGVRQRLKGSAAGADASSGAKRSVAEMLLTDQTEGLTTMDIRTILGGLMSGGFETVYSTAIIALGVLSRAPDGHRMQQRAYADIMAHYASPEAAFAASVLEEKSPYVAALAKEALRFYPPLKLLPARQTFKDFACGDALVPKGVLVYINAQAINRDKAAYGADADTFRPERWLEGPPGGPPGSPPQGPPHFAYGAGARMCTAVNFSNRVLYAMFLRLIVAFRIDASPALPANTDYIAYKKDAAAANAIAADFRVRLTPRDVAALERSLEQSQIHAGALCNEQLKR